MDKRFLGILVAIVAVFVVIFAVNQNSSNGSNNSNGNTGAKQPTNHVEGQGTSGVTLVEYGDYECSVCETYYQPLKQVVAKYGDKIKFQFRNLPLTQIHPNAFASARAAEAAGLQNKYWEMHDKLYENQDPYGASGWVADKDPLDNYFVKFAQDIGLNVAKFKQDYSSDKVNNFINADLDEFSKTNQPMATPSFFINGKYIDNSKLGVPGSSPYQLNATATVDNFSKLIDAAMTKK